MNTQYLTNLFVKIIPLKYHKHLSLIKHYILRGYTNKYYGQWAEDALLNSILDTKKGFYIDIGAHHPFLDSNTYMLYKRDWNGINIDPLPEGIQLFNITRKRDINLNIAIGPNKKLKYFMFAAPNFNTFNSEQAERAKEQGVKLISTKNIQCIPLSKILHQYAKNKKIDLLSIDVEGFEIAVLETNDWTNYSPKIIVIEDLNFDINKLNKNSIYNFLRKKNYKLVMLTKFNSIYQLEN